MSAGRSSRRSPSGPLRADAGGVPAAGGDGDPGAERVGVAPAASKPRFAATSVATRATTTTAAAAPATGAIVRRLLGGRAGTPGSVVLTAKTATGSAMPLR